MPCLPVDYPGCVKLIGKFASARNNAKSAPSPCIFLSWHQNYFIVGLNGCTQ